MPSVVGKDPLLCGTQWRVGQISVQRNISHSLRAGGPAPRAGGRGARRITPAIAAGQAVGLLGGSFNPAHGGHLALSLAALRHLRLDRVWWLVTPQNPLKRADSYLDLADRCARARLVTARHPRIVVSDIEARLGVRYTVETVGALRERFPRTRFVWLMGADSLAGFHRWRRWREIVRLLPIAVFSRPGQTTRAALGLGAGALRRAWIPPTRAASLARCSPPAWTLLRTVHDPSSATALREIEKPFLGRQNGVI